MLWRRLRRNHVHLRWRFVIYLNIHPLRNERVKKHEAVGKYKEAMTNRRYHSAHHSSGVNYVSCKMNFSKPDCFVMSIFDGRIIAEKKRI